MKKTNIINSILIVFFIVLLFFLAKGANYSCKQKKKYDIISENSKKIQIGMLEKDVLTIMGKPDIIINETNVIYCYEINNDSFGNGQIVFDSTMMVKEIYFPCCP